MKKLLLLFAAIVLCFSTYSQEISKIDAQLREEMQLRNDGELIRINILFKAQYDQSELGSKASIYRLKEDRRSFVMNELKRHSKETQQEVMSYLYNYERYNSVSEIKQFWIFNGITCIATKEVINELSYLDDILLIGSDNEINMLPPVLNPQPAEPTRELTYNITKVKANKVWDELGYEGEGVIVAVFDTGVNYDHNDLKTHMWMHPDFPYHGWNFANNNNNPKDDHYYNFYGNISQGHGTHCAGTIAGNGTSGSQTGMAPNATIMALKVLNNQGGGQPSSVVAALQFGIEHGAHVFSMSIGWPQSDAGGATRIQYRTTMGNVLQAGIVASVAAGNEGGGTPYVPQNIRTPGDCPPPWLHPDQTVHAGVSAVVCVGATNTNDVATSWSSRGPVTWQSSTPFNDYPYNPGIGLIRPDVCAPGENIKSCMWNNNAGYQSMSGTSMATPCVAGVMALMLSKNPELTPAQICEILETTAVRLPSTSSPKGNTYGSGRIDAFEAVSLVPEYIHCDTVSNLSYTLEYDKVVRLKWDKPEVYDELLGYYFFVNGTQMCGLIPQETYTYWAYEEDEYKFCIKAVYEDCESEYVCKIVNVISICEPATALTANVTGNNILLSWKAPSLTWEVLQYKIYCDNEFLTETVEDSLLVEGTAGKHIYSVEVEYKNECISDTISIEVLVLEAPINLTANSQSGIIELSWEYDDNSMFFNLYRDDKKITSDIIEKHFSDLEAEGGVEHCYNVKATNKEIESAASNVACAAIIGIEEYSNSLKIYPSPSKSIVNIEGEHIETITIHNSLGQIVKFVHSTGNHNSIDVSNLVPGSYIFTIHFTNNSTENVKIIVQ
ncbi:MAG: S8 family serine peptidase [Bacteroidales bacterium]|nr:S8 family serine peptidase [Bacteroidales bacterium]